MRNAYSKDIIRSMKNSWKRFLSILLITALGVTVLSGIYAACMDMYDSADQFYDEQQLFDIRILSTLGLTEADVELLQDVTGVAVAEGGYSETVHTLTESGKKSVQMTILGAKGLNAPYVLTGRLPERAGEIAVTNKYLKETGKQIGDIVTIEETLSAEEDAEPEEVSVDAGIASDEEELFTEIEIEVEDDAEKPTFPNPVFTITGTVIDPTYINNTEDGKEFRSNATTDYTFFLLPVDADYEVYTSVYLTLDGLALMNCYSPEYEQAVDACVQTIEEQIKKQREEARDQEIMDQATGKISDAEKTMNDQFAEADEKLEDAWQDIISAWQELTDGEATLTKEEKDALQALADARVELADGRKELENGEQELADGQTELEENAAKLADGKQEWQEGEATALEEFADAEQIFQQKQWELEDSEFELNANIRTLKQMFAMVWPEAAWDQYLQAVTAETVRQLSADPQNQPNPTVIAEAVSAARASLIANVPDEFQEIADNLALAGLGLGIIDGGQQVLTAQKTTFEEMKEGVLAQLAEAREQAAEEFQAGRQYLTEQQELLIQSRETLELEIEQLRDLLADEWPDSEWEELVSDAAAETLRLIAENPESPPEPEAIAAATQPQQMDLAAALPAAFQELTEDCLQAALGYGILQGSEEAFTEQADQLEQQEQQVFERLDAEQEQAQQEFDQAGPIFELKQQELDASRTQAEGGVTQLKALFDARWPSRAWKDLVEEMTDAAYTRIMDDPEYPPDLQDIEKLTLEEQDEFYWLLDPGARDMADNMIQAAIGMGLIKGGQKALVEQRGEYETMKSDALKELADAYAELEDGEIKLEEGRRELEDGRRELEEGWQEWQEGEAELNSEEAKALKGLADARKELEDGRKELADGQDELLANEEEYHKKQAEARQKLADAYQELEDLDMTKWYVQSRSSLDSYTSLENDLSSIETLGQVFPAVFLLVAILISLTTMTRMVEEERGLIGAYKAIGFGDLKISAKYLMYAFLASVLGGAAGCFFGFVILPKFLLSILGSLYTIPVMVLKFDSLYGIGGSLLFVIAITGATALACQNELRATPAALMRPKAPRAGSRVFLEYLPPIWKRLKFLNKVTARNLFRYKKRLFMTVIGIAGCTALVLIGFAIKDSVNLLMPKQYGDVYRYDLLLAANPDEKETLEELLGSETAISDYLEVGLTNVKVINAAGRSESLQLMVIPAEAPFNEYIRTRNDQGADLTLADDGVIMTRNAAEMLGLQPGDPFTIQDLDLVQQETAVTAISENYLGNQIYMTEQLYTRLFGELIPNSALIHLDLPLDAQPEYADTLLDHDGIMTAVSTERLREDFSSNFAMVNSVVYLFIILAAGLAVVVLFTLSTTNISERERELATIKVLGFYDPEVHSYVNKETILLTLLGIAAGLPAGDFISRLLTIALKMPNIYFAVSIEPISYLYAALISFGFTLMVNLITNRTLNRINMVEALKSVE